MNGFVAVLEAIFGGYAVAVGVHIVLIFLMTREGRGVLMTGAGMSQLYYVQLGLCWMVAAAAGAEVALHVFPALPMAAAALASIAAMLCLALTRVRNKVPHQQTLGDTLLLLLCVLVGLGVPAYVQLT